MPALSHFMLVLYFIVDLQVRLLLVRGGAASLPWGAVWRQRRYAAFSCTGQL